VKKKGGNRKNMLDFVLSARYASLFYTVIKLGIPELTKDEFVHVDILAKKSEADATALFRILRALTGIKIFKEKNKLFKLTKHASPLLSNSEDSITDVILWIIEWKRKVWDNVLYSVKTGKPAFDDVYKKPLFDFLPENPKVQELFDKVMAQRTKLNTTNILKCYDFSDAKTIVDIGGGNGMLLSEILKKYTSAKGILFDASDIINKEDNLLKKCNLDIRCKLTEGDFFKSVPKNGDIYILKEVLHDWDDEKSISILKNCANAMNKDGKILIIEHAADMKYPGSLLLDVSMLLTTGGQERTKKEFKKIFKEAGLSLIKTHKTNSSLKIIECSLIDNDKNA